MQYSDNASLNAITVHVQYWQEYKLVPRSLLGVCVCMRAFKLMCVSDHVWVSRCVHVCVY